MLQRAEKDVFFCFRDGRGGYLFASERGGRRQFSFCLKEGGGGSFLLQRAEKDVFFCFRDGRGGYLFALERGGRRQFSFCLKEVGGGSMFCFRERGRRVILLVVDQQAAFLYRGLCGVIMGRRVILLHFRQSDRR